MSFKLEIVTPDGLLYDGDAEKIIVRTTEGDVGILSNHADYVAALSIGVARIFTKTEEKKAACAGGLLSVTNPNVRVVASTFEWSEDIDVERAKKARCCTKERFRPRKRG